MSGIPAPEESQPRGIVITTGPSESRPVRFWAYLWAADEETEPDHWHDRVPAERAA